MDFTWLRIQICWSQVPEKKGRGVVKKTSQYLVWPQFASCITTHLLRIELIVACGMLSYSSIAVRSCWILAGTGTCCRPWRFKASQTCSISDMSDEYTGQNRDIFVIKELCTDPSDMGLCIIMLKHVVMAADEWYNNGPRDLVTVSLCIQIAID